MHIVSDPGSPTRLAGPARSSRSSHRRRWQPRAAGALAATLLTALAAPTARAAPEAYVLSGTARQLSVIDAATDTVAAGLPLAPAPVAVAVTPDGRRIALAHSSPATVVVLDGVTRATVATLALDAAPSAVALSPDGSRVHLMLAGGELRTIDAATGATLASMALGSAGGLAASADGRRIYVAAGALHVVDAATLALLASVPLGADQSAWRVVLAENGREAWVTATFGLFTGGVVVVDTRALTVRRTIPLGAIPGPIALAPDGSRAYVGVQATWVDTGYGAGFFPGRTVNVLDAATSRWVGAIDLGADGANWTQQNTAAGIAVTPDRGSVVISVPRIAQVVTADVNQPSAVRARIPVAASPGAVAAALRGTDPVVRYTLLAEDDVAQATTLGGIALASVLANDRYGGIVPTTKHVRLVQTAATDPGLALDTKTGAVRVAAGLPPGPQRIDYRLCERSDPARCDDASVAVTIVPPQPIDAVDDTFAAYPGTAAAGNVRANDTLGGLAAGSSTTQLKTLSSSHPGLTLNPATGQLAVATGTPAGTYRLRYRLCETAVAANCDSATATVTVTARPVVATDDSAAAPRTGGTAIANVRANDTLAGLAASAANTTLATLAADAGLTLDPATGALQVAAGTATGLRTLSYRLCETAMPANCDDAVVRITVAPYVVDAVDDSAKASSKRAGTAIASVLVNDRYAGRAATAADVTMQQVSLTPANPKIRFDPADGSVDILGETQSGDYRLVYRICEIGDRGNCDEATVWLELSGGV